MAAITPAPATLADVWARGSSRARDVVLVVGFAALTAVSAQLTVRLPWTPVPITGQTFAVLMSGAVLGFRRGTLSQVLYVAVGALGAPVYAGSTGGWAALTGATGGYLVGFVLAAALVGALSDRHHDRVLLTSLPAMVAANAVIYAAGLPWLAHSLHVSATKAMELGLVPFVIGDAIKLVVAGALTPPAWRLVDRRRQQ